MASVLIFAGGVIVEDRLVLQTDPIQWVNQDSQVIKDLHTLEEETGSSSELGIYVQADDVFTDEVSTFVDEFSREQLAEEPEVLLTASSIVNTVGYLTDVPGTEPISPTGEIVEAAYEVAPADVQHSVIGRDGTAMNLIFRTGPASLEERAVVVNDIRETISPPPGVYCHPVRAGGRGRRPPREPRGEPHPAHLPRDHVRVPLPRRCGSAPSCGRCSRSCRC